MRFAWLASTMCCGILLAGSPEQDNNINARYTVESVEFAGNNPAPISLGLRGEITKLIGEKLNPAALDDLALRIRHELHVRAVTHHLLRGNTPAHVRVVFDVVGQPARFDASVPSLIYRSDGGMSGIAQGVATIGSQAFTVGAVTNGDDLAERYTGLFARYELKHLGSDRVRFRFDFQDYHEQWNPATAAAFNQPFATDVSGLYRSRDNLEPLVTFVISRGAPGNLNLTLGTSFERFQPEFPAARTESANAMVTTLRYHRRLEGSNANQQEWDAGYSLRAATNVLGGDFAYTRHQGDVQYASIWGHSRIQDSFTAGEIDGQAPLYERFMLGNSTMLRGWNRFDLDPLGGSRVVANSVEYRYGLLDVFYDCGAIWDQGQAAVLRHSAGIGIRQNRLYAALAFPIKEGHIEPVFLAGMNY